MLDENLPLPLYAQLRDVLVSRIESGVWSPGERIPTEMELMKEYGVGRATVRQAVLDLVNKGLLYRKQGKGTFVNAETGHCDLELALSFTAEMLARGAAPGAEVLKKEVVAADKEVREKLGLKRGQKVLRLERLRTADGAAMAFEVSHLNYQLVPGIENGNLAGSLYQLVTRVYGVPLLHARHTIHAEAAQEPVAGMIGVPPGSPVLVLERVTFTRNNVAVDCVRFECRSDLYRVALESHRPRVE